MGIEIATTADLARVVRERGLQKLDVPRVLASGDLSFYFVNVKRALDHGAVLRAAGELLSHAAGVELGLDYDVIAGPAMGGICVTDAIHWAEQDREPPPRSVYIAAEPEPQGRLVSRIWSWKSLEPGDRILWAEDTISRGGTSRERMQLMRDDPGFPEDARVVGAVSVVERGDNPAAMFEAMGIPFTALISYRDLGIPAVGTEVIPRAQP